MNLFRVYDGAYSVLISSWIQRRRSPHRGSIESCQTSEWRGRGITTPFCYTWLIHDPLQANWILEKFYPTSLAFIKCSIIVFLQRLFHTNRKFYIATSILIGIISCWAFAALMANTFQCWPVEYYYDKTIKGGHCMKNQLKFFLAIGSFSFVEDVAVLIAPIPVVWSLQMNFRKKMALILVFSLGCGYVTFLLGQLPRTPGWLLVCESGRGRKCGDV